MPELIDLGPVWWRERETGDESMSNHASVRRATALPMAKLNDD
jgi:hypothetical protein